MQLRRERTPEAVQCTAAQKLIVELTNGDQVQLDPDDRIYTSLRRRLALDEVPRVLLNPRRWIEHETAARIVQEEREREPWEEDEDEEPAMKARVRIYARAVVSVMLVYGEAAA